MGKWVSSLWLYPTLYYFSLYFSLSLKKRQENLKGKNHPNKTKHTKNMESICVGQLLLSISSPLKCGCCTKCHSTGEGWFPSFHKVSITSSFLVRGGSLYTFPLSIREFLCCFNCLCRPYVFYHNLCEFTHVLVLWCLKSCVPLASSTIYSSYNLFCLLCVIDPWPLRGGVW